MDIQNKKENKMYFIFSNEDGSIIIRADSEEQAIQTAHDYDMDWDAVIETPCYFANEE